MKSDSSLMMNRTVIGTITGVDLFFWRTPPVFLGDTSKCMRVFLALTNIKTKYRFRLNVESDQ